MEKKLEQLLNSLIQKWRVPFGDEKINSFEIIYVTWKILNIVARRWRWQVNKHYSIIELCSKSSWLRQFVCENNLNYSEDDSIYNVWLKYYAEDDHESPYTYASPVWYIIESALCDEDKLEEFLLNSIKLN